MTQHGIKYAQAADGRDSEIIHAALRLLYVLGHGESASADEFSSAAFHLWSIRVELTTQGQAPSPSQLSYALAARVAPEYGRSSSPWSTPMIEPHWLGDGLAAIEPARFYISAALGWSPLRDEESSLLAFYHGNQWDEQVKNERLLNSRPCLVVNRLPALVAAAVAREDHPPSSLCHRLMLDRLMLVMTHRNQDAQRLYNFECSARAEQSALFARPQFGALPDFMKEWAAPIVNLP